MFPEVKKLKLNQFIFLPRSGIITINYKNILVPRQYRIYNKKMLGYFFILAFNT